MKRKGVLYAEIADTIKIDIQNNKYPIGTMLPTENEFEALFDVSKITIRKAIEVLALQGYVEKKSGRGTTVISNRLFNKLSKGDSFSTILEKRGLDVHKTIVAVDEITLEPGHTYYDYFGAKATKVTRMYDANNQPYILFKHYLPATVFKPTQDKLATTSMYRILADHGFLVDHFQDQFTVCMIGEEEQALLKTSETHLIQRVRTSYDQDKNVIEVSDSIYNTTLHPYEIEFEI